ncbi:4'-phosphopantetheinyl transferase family protein [Bordetella genomosp. 13]|uniref:4'-phosphopantetheinyl transferase family protein n=1 Tax=Bordetella genomosp. 13 TaxID=463040 RepID=UPI0011A06F24|nr:4'-phosphopantetheinyl transferase superfamily protein [Bordetella genomosp. 13]
MSGPEESPDLRRLPLPDDAGDALAVHCLRLDLEAEPHDHLHVLSEDERARNSRYLQRADRVRHAATRAALRRLLAQRLDCPPAQLRFTAGPQGKPLLAQAPDLPFNVSHAGRYALIAIGDARAIAQVGVDIEQCKDTLDPDAIGPLVYTEEERAAVRAAPQPRAHAFRLWVVKEALLKASGAGITEHLQAVSLTLFPDAPPRLRARPGLLDGMAVRELAAPRGYAAALAWTARSMG